MKQVLEERRLQKQKKIDRYKGEKKAIDTVLDPYVIDDLRNIIKTYLKPQI